MDFSKIETNYEERASVAKGKVIQYGGMSKYVNDNRFVNFKYNFGQISKG